MHDGTLTGRDDIVVVGPVHPLKGGIAQHTAELARQAKARGLSVRVESWRSQYPRWLYPGETEVPSGSAEGEPVERTTRRMQWWNPLTWFGAGRRMRSADIVVLTAVVPFHAVPYRVLLAGLGRRRPRVVLVCHNVLPHEPTRVDRPLMRALVRVVDHTIVHTEEQAALARDLGARAVSVVPLPPHLPFGATARTVGEPTSRRLVFFGFVRPYKGLDDLLHALACVDDVALTVCGEVWGGRDAITRTIEALGLQHRVTLIDRYVEAESIPSVFEGHDALVAPYRTGTASQQVLIAHRLGLPVIATRVGSFPSQIDDGTNGLLCEPSDVEGLAATIRRLYEPGVLEHLRRNVPSVDGSSEWDDYVSAVRGRLRARAGDGGGCPT